MKKSLFFCLALLSGLTLSAADRTKIKFAAAVREITPPLGAWAEGFPVGPKSPRTIGVREKLYLRILAIRDFKGKTLVIVSGDMLMITFDKVIKDYCVKKHKLNSGDVLLNASHTHFTSWTVGKYGTEVIKKTESAIDEALANLQDGYVKFGLDQANLGVCRRLKTETGRMICSPNPKGYSDHDLPVFAFYNNAGTLKTIIWSYAAHPSIRIGPDCGKYITSSVPGIINRQLHKICGSDICTVFLQGAAGDVWFTVGSKLIYNPAKKRYAYEKNPIPLKDMDEGCMKAARNIVNFIKSPKMHKINVDLAAADGKVILHYDLEHPQLRNKILTREEIEKRIKDPKSPAKKLRFYKYQLRAGWYKGGDPTNDFVIARVRINDKLQIVGTAGEPTSLLGRDIKNAYPGKTTIMLGYISQRTYLADTRQQREGGYEAKCYKGNIEDILVKHFNSLKLK